MAIKEWTTVYPISIDTTTEMPDLYDNEDYALASQILSVRDSMLQLEQYVGAEVPASGTLRDRVNTLESGTTSSPLTTKGDIYVYSDDNTRFPVGTDGQFLSADSTESTGLKWVDSTVSGDTSPLTTKGDLYTYTTSGTRLPVGINNQILIADSAESTGIRWGSGFSTITSSGTVWKYLGEDSTIGLNALAIYQFDGTANQLNDRSGNGYTLTKIAGNIRQCVLSGKIGLWFDGITYYQAAGTDEALRLVGACTIEVIFLASRIATSNAMDLIDMTATGESLATNILYSLRLDADKLLYYFCEYGAGTNEPCTTDVNVGDVVHVATLTRSAVGYLKFYLDGNLVYESSSISPEKDVSGNQQLLCIGAFSDGSIILEDVGISSVRISNVEFTQNQVSSVFREIMQTSSISPLTTKGDVYVYSDENTRLPVGTDGQFLSVDSTESTGLKWVSQDTKSPKGTWATTSTVDFAARPGQSSTVRLTLQDGKQRTTTSGTWDISNGVADWGYDEAASQGNSKWLYFYAVPKSADDDYLVVRASDNSLSTGPTGYSNYKIVWKTYIDSSGNLINVIQRNNEFQYNSQADGDIYSGNGAGYIEPETSYASVDLSVQVPTGVEEVQFKCYIDVSAENPAAYWTILWSLDGINANRALDHRGDISTSLNAQNTWYMPITSSGTIYRKRQRNSGTNDLAYISYGVYSWIDEEVDS